MGWYGPQGDCGCCGDPPCQLVAAGSYDSGDFTVLSGAFTFGSNITCTSSGQLQCDAATMGQVDHRMQGEFPVGRAYLVDYQDSSNYFKVERTNTTTVVLSSVVGGSPTTLKTYTVSSSVDAVRICVYGTTIFVTNIISLSGDIISESGSSEVTRFDSPTVVIEMATSDEETVFEFSDKGCGVSCRGLNCDYICKDGFPDQVYLELGWVGNYVLDFVFIDVAEHQCSWEYNAPNTNPCDGPVNIRMAIHNGFGANFGVYVSYFLPPSTPSFIYAGYSFSNTNFDNSAIGCLPRSLTRNGNNAPPSGCSYPGEFPATGNVEAA